MTDGRTDSHPDTDPLRDAIRTALAEDPGALTFSSIAGGSIHHAMRACGETGTWFIKWNITTSLPLFEAEAEGLLRLAQTSGPKVPDVITCGHDARHSWLILQHLDLVSYGDSTALGTALADLHRETSDAHGWPADNYIGHTPQHNGLCRDWPQFWWERRLRPQLAMAEAAGYDIGCDAEALKAASQRLLQHEPSASLLHGDLWGGNHGYLVNGQPVLFDPACWFGDRETDLAMMHLFGGFDPDVFRAYAGAWPLSEGHEDRLPLYQLYHVLNHLNLFGSAWLGRFDSLLARVLSAAGSP